MERIDINSATWKNTVGLKSKDEYEADCIKLFYSSFTNTRKNAKALAELINRELPFFTAHNDKHFDALWNCADLLLDWGNPKKKPSPLNPAEGYVLGLSFLLHDLGMGLAAYADGIDDLKDHPSFQDALADEFLDEKKHSIEPAEMTGILNQLHENPHNSSMWPPYAQRAAARMIRKLHAEKARKLGTQGWMYNKKTIYLIDGDELREHYGETAGVIAASHGWNYDKLREELGEDEIAPPAGFPDEWKVDSCKLACILRVADAIQIDSVRAESFPMALRHLEGESKNHWIFQNKLRKPTIKSERLCFSCKSSFSQEEMDAWWLCYDTLRMADQELRDADAFLTETGRTPFRARAIYGISSPQELCKQIKITDDWVPMDTTIRVGDVGRLVSTLGGAQLYGEENKWVPFREMIQNGADAIRARKSLEGDNWDPRQGKIIISLYEQDGKRCISFTDTGIGMSEAVLTGPFLDFGQSFWNTSLMHKEWPGLASTGYQHTGQYGIGFFSVFMWTTNVKVVTRKYTNGREKTLALEFREGVKCRPILRKANMDEVKMVSDGGTTVVLQIDDTALWGAIISGNIFHENESLADSIAMYFPCLECDLFLNQDGNMLQIIKADDWKTIEPLMLVKRLAGRAAFGQLSQVKSFDKAFVPFAQNMEPILDENGVWLGRAFIQFLLNDTPYEELIDLCGRVIVQGCSEKPSLCFFNQFVSGVFLGKAEKVDRFHGVSFISNMFWKQWLNSQTDKLLKMKIRPGQQLILSSLLAEYNVLRDDLFIAKSGSNYWTYQQIVDMAKDPKNTIFFLAEDNLRICKPITRELGKEGSKLIVDLGYIKQLKKQGIILMDGWGQLRTIKYAVAAVKEGFKISSENERFHVFSSPSDTKYIMKTINNALKKINKTYYVQNTINQTVNNFVLITREEAHFKEES